MKKNIYSSWGGVEVKSTEKKKPKPEGFGIGESAQKELKLQVGEALKISCMMYMIHDE